jgi:hypothetical protein
MNEAPRDPAPDLVGNVCPPLGSLPTDGIR